MTASNRGARVPAFERIPADAPLVACYAVLVGGAIVLGVVDGAVRVLLAAPLVGFLPGYSVLSALFPADRPAGTARPGSWRLPVGDGLGWVERCALSVATSLALIPLLAVLLGIAGVELSTSTVTGVLVAVVLVGVVVGGVRRFRVAPGRGYDVPVDRWRGELQAGWERAGHADRALNAIVIVVALLAITGLAVGLAAPNQGESYTEAALLTDGPDGLVAGNFPETVSAGESLDLVLTVDNRLGTATEYEIVVVLDRVERTDEGRSLTVLERSELSRFGLSVVDGGQARRDITASPDLVGENLRMSVFVYRGDAPESPSASTASEHLYLWLDVE